MKLPRLHLSTLPPFDFAQRVCSYFVWGIVLLVVLPLFFAFELTGLLPFTPWRTLSETGWDLEKHHPVIKRKLCGFLFGLAMHFWGRTTLRSSYSWGLAFVDDLGAEK